MKFGNTTIGGMSLGSTRIGGAKYGSTLVFQPGSQPTTGTPYIRGGADGSYIDTGITADNTVKVIVWARNWNPGSGFLFGSRVAANQNNYGLGAHGLQNTGRIRMDYAQGQTFADDQFSNLSHYHKYELYQGVLKVDDTIQASTTDSTFSNNVNIHLLGVNTNGTHANPDLPIDLCACQIYKGGNLVRDYTAANSPSIGLYDAVSDTVFTNAGSGSFSYGTFNTQAYTPIEYIECSSAQVFNSGTTVSYSDIVVSKLRGTETTPRFYYPWVAYEAEQDSKRFRCYFGNASSVNYRFYIEFGSATASQLYSSTNPRLTDLDIIFVKTNNKAILYRNNSVMGTERTTSATSTTVSSNLYVGAGASGSSGEAFKGRLYYLGIGSKRCFVPGKVGTSVGMYDTYNDMFYPSETETPFIAGPTI